jgi:arylsulfatase A
MKATQPWIWCLIGFFCLRTVEAQPVDIKRPNIVYILADDLGIGDVSAFNSDSRLKTIHIDRLAETGKKFTDAHTGSSVCTPTRYGILTGRYCWRTELKKGVLSGYSRSLIPPDRLTVAKLLENNGYHTAFVGKWHLGWDWQINGDDKGINSLDARPEVDFTRPIARGPAELGFTYSYGFSGSLDMAPYVYVENGKVTSQPTRKTVSTDQKGFWREGLTSDDFIHAEVLPHVTRKAIAYIDAQSAKKQPFFLYFALPAPHTPILPSSPFLGRSNTNFYGDFVLETDDVVGQILSALERNGVRENTLVIFTSDNGCSPRAGFDELAQVGHDPNNGYRGSKADLYEGGHRVPFVVSWPEAVEEGSVSQETICTTDLMATLAELIGVKLPDHVAEDSFSFLSDLVATSSQGAVQRGIVHHSVEGRFAIRKGKWKLILWPGSGGWSSPKSGEESKGLPAFQLFDLEIDPSEQVNRVADHPDKVSELRALLIEYIQNGRSTPGEPLKNDGNRTWKELEAIETF